MFKTLLLCSLSTLALWGCSSTSTTALGATANADEISPEGRLYADYLVGSYANYLDDAPTRSKYYARAYEGAKSDVILGRRAATSALTAGDLDLARKLAQDINAIDADEPMARAILGAREFSSARYGNASDYFDEATSDLTIRILMKLMQGWNQAAQGEIEAAKTTFSTIGGGRYFDAMGTFQTAVLETQYGDSAVGLSEFESISELGIAPIEATLAHARAYIINGQTNEALEFLTSFNDENGPFETGPILKMINDLKSGRLIEAELSPQKLAARALTESAFGFFVRNRASDAAEVFLQFALELDPDHDKAKLWLGSVIENSGRDDDAMKLYDSIDESSSYIVSARLSKANVYFSQDEDGKALKILEATNAQYPSFITRESLGRARLIRENYDEALPLYDALVQSMSEDEIKSNPEPLYFRAICFERTGEWEKAVMDFQRVLDINPDSADALNYLGYTWVDRGENLTEAFDMIKKAVELEPDSGAITDSLGWAYFKLGQYNQAKTHLETAVELSPSSATIIDHLGDVYWKLGRFREAGYQWERALEFEPTEKEEKSIRKKLKNGLESIDASP